MLDTHYLIADKLANALANCKEKVASIAATLAPKSVALASA